MKCDLCDKEAVVHLTQVDNGEMKEVHLCEEHAKEQGIDINSPISITDILMGLGEARQGIESELSPTCPRCGMAREEFRQTGRLGCPDCYNTFMAELTMAVKAMHHSNQHVGKIPAREGLQTRIKSQIARLQKDLEAAVAREEYEKAAKIRDQINEVREQVESDGGAL
ncbi:MAG: UvrB/UvrC motif-containing protein [Kiritimatiellaceae bacterium]|nr:UvrB/UvrC motif-containing protein [Kiritimatiellaceae bacterium]